MAPHKCVYLGCDNTSDTKSMFRFPNHDKNRSLVWLINSGNMNNTRLTQQNLRTRYLCSDHFDRKDITNQTGYRRHLQKTAVPIPYQAPDTQDTSVSSPGIDDPETAQFEDFTIGGAEPMNINTENSPVNTISQHVGENESHWLNDAAFDIGIDTHVDPETAHFDELTIGSIDVVNATQQNVVENQNNRQNVAAYNINIDTHNVDPEMSQFVLFLDHSPANTITQHNVVENQSNDQIVPKCDGNNIEKKNLSNTAITDTNTNSSNNEISNVAIKDNNIENKGKSKIGEKHKKKLNSNVDFRILAKLIKRNIEEKIKNNNLQIIVKNDSNIASNKDEDTIKTQHVTRLDHKAMALNPVLSEFLKIKDMEDTPKEDKFTITRLELLKEWLIDPKATLTEQNQRLFKYISSKINLNEIQESEFQVKIFVVYIAYQISELLAKCRGNLHVFYDKNTDWLSGSPKKFTPKDPTERPLINIEDGPHQVQSNFTSQQVVLETNEDLFKFIKSSDPPFKPEPLFNKLSSLIELTDQHKTKLMDFCKRYACDTHFKWMTANQDYSKFLTKFEYWLQLKPRFPGFIQALKEHYPSIKKDPKIHLRPLELALLKCTDVPKDLSKVIHRFVHHPEDSDRITTYISTFECNCESESCDIPRIKLEDEGLESDPLAFDGNLPFEITNTIQTRDRIEDVSQVMERLKCLSEGTGKNVEPSKLDFGPVLDQLLITKKPLPVKPGAKIFLPGSKLGIVAKVSNIKFGTVVVPVSKLSKGMKVKKKSSTCNTVKTTALIRSYEDEREIDETAMTASTSNENNQETYTTHKVYGPSRTYNTSMPKAGNLPKTQNTITIVDNLPTMLTRPKHSVLTGQSATGESVKTASVFSILNDKKRILQLAKSGNLNTAKLKSLTDKTNAELTRPYYILNSSKPPGPIILNNFLAGKSRETPNTLPMANIKKTPNDASKNTNIGKVPLILKKSIAVKRLLSDINSGNLQKEKSKSNTKLVCMALDEFQKRVYTLDSSLDKESEPPVKKELTEIDKLLENVLKTKIKLPRLAEDS